MYNDKTTLITGGHGMVGQALKSILPNAEAPRKQDMNLLRSVKLNKIKHIIHLAAKVGGVKGNTDLVADFYLENQKINHNILSAAHESGVRKVISLLSTCVYPDSPYISYPLTEEQLHLGPPHPSNFGYAYAKRMVDVMSRAYRQQYECNFVTAIPNNLYGENDNFDLENGHVIPSLMRKIWEAKIKNIPYVECWGDGMSLREFTYSKDIAKILLFLLENYDEAHPINIGNTEEYSIKEVVSLLCENLEYSGEIIWNTDMPSGQFRKPSSNKKLTDLGWDKEWYTPLKEGLKNTCKWFIINYPNVRGVH
ncbi:MAG: GDP-fucose synthetase [Rhodobacteraceae bacterium]|nr:GDP-fucose synthetase [Paracoccaceae bacterium]|tara:strand:+ start:12863 stop:13789 length:927 start_codon:yes stop_codon:yes gene_type:complete